MSESPSALQRPQTQRRDMLARWFLQEDPTEAAQRGNSLLSSWQTKDTSRIWDLGQYAKLYGTSYLGFPGSIFARQVSTRKQKLRDPNAATFNGTKSCVDTLASTITQHKPVAQYTPTDAAWDAQRVAKLRNRWTGGWFYEQQFYEKLRQQFVDALVFGDGLLYVGPERGRAVIRRMFAGDVYMPPGQTLTDSANPRECGWVQLVDRYQAWMDWKGNRDAQRAIENAPEVNLTVDDYVSEQDDLIQLNTLWRVPSGEGAGDGRRLISVQGGDPRTSCVDFSEWTHPALPISRIRCNPRSWGYWSEGFAELLEDTQLQYNQLARSVNEAIELGGRFKLWMDTSTQLVAEALTDEIGSVLRGDKPPVSMLWECVQPEVYARLEKLEALFFRQTGIAQMAATSEKVSPDESGIAIRERVEVYTQRFGPQVQSYQDSPLTVAKLGIWAVEDILANSEQKSYRVYSVVGPASEALDFKDLKFRKNEQYVITCLPMNDLPDTLEGRVAMAEDFVNAGYYDEETARQAFQLPDIARIETLYNAQYQIAMKNLDQLCADKDAEIPVVDVLSDNLPLLLRLAQQHLAYGRLRDLDEAILDNLRKYIAAIKLRIKQGEPEQAPTPLANPQAPPTSELVPNPNAPALAAA